MDPNLLKNKSIFLDKGNPSNLSFKDLMKEKEIINMVTNNSTSQEIYSNNSHRYRLITRLKCFLMIKYKGKILGLVNPKETLSQIYSTTKKPMNTLVVSTLISNLNKKILIFFISLNKTSNNNLKELIMILLKKINFQTSPTTPFSRRNKNNFDCKITINKTLRRQRKTSNTMIIISE